MASPAIPPPPAGATPISAMPPPPPGAAEIKDAPDSSTGVVEQVFKSLHNQAKGMFEVLHGLVDPEVAQKIGQGEVDAQVHEWEKAKDAYSKGNYLGAITGALGAAVPIIGPLINQTGEKLATEGQRAEGLTDIAGPLLLGKAISKAPDIAEGLGTAKAIVTDPAVIRKGIKIIPKGGAAIDWWDELKRVVDERKQAQTPAKVEPAIPQGIDPELWQKLSPQMQERIRTGQTAAPPPTSTPQPPRDPSYYGVESKPTPKEAPAPEPVAEKPAEAPKSAPSDALTQKIHDLLRQVKIEAGIDPDLPLGEVKGGRYPSRFGSAEDSPIVESQKRKPYSTAEPANPGMIAKDLGDKLAGKMTVEHFDSPNTQAGLKIVLKRQYGVDADDAMIKAIRRRIAAKASEVSTPSTINISDLMKR